jgi:hypothetical protein
MKVQTNKQGQRQSNSQGNAKRIQRLRVRTDIRAGAYLGVTITAGLDDPGSSDAA